MSQSTKAAPMTKDETMLFVQLVAAKTAIHSKVSGSGTAKRKCKLEEDLCKALIARENAMTEYLIAKKKKLDLENEVQDAEAKLKLELKNTKLENLKLKQKLNLRK